MCVRGWLFLLFLPFFASRSFILNTTCCGRCMGMDNCGLEFVFFFHFFLVLPMAPEGISFLYMRMCVS